MLIRCNNNEIDFKVVSIATEKSLNGSSIIGVDAFEEGEYRGSLSITIKSKFLNNKKRIRELLESEYSRYRYELSIKNKKATIKVGDMI